VAEVDGNKVVEWLKSMEKNCLVAEVDGNKIVERQKSMETNLFVG
jgi:hypothetical protein